MKTIFKKLIVLTIILATLFTNSNVVFCDDNQTVTIEYIVKAKVTFIDDLTHDESHEEYNVGNKLIEPTHSDNPNYEFLGWFNGDVKWNFDTDIVENHLTLHAKYDAKIVPGPRPGYNIPNTGINAIDEIVEAIETNNSFNSFICMLLLILIVIVLYIILSKDKDDEDNNNSHKTKLIKKLFIITLCSMCVLSSSNIYAEDDDTITVTEDGNYNVKLVAEIAAATYEIVVPASVDLNQEESFDVLGKADFFLYNDEPIQDLIISVDNTITFKNTIDETYTFDATVVSTLKESYTNTDINPMDASEYSNLGNISFSLPTSFTASGAYKGTLTFTYELRDKESE